jgi:hypothetical protein
MERLCPDGRITVPGERGSVPELREDPLDANMLLYDGPSRAGATDDEDRTAEHSALRSYAPSSSSSSGAVGT